MRTYRRGFTLIELLVVVAIIALLISILLPSLYRAREQSKIVVCASNLHQIGIAMQFYTDDNDDCYPDEWSGGPSMVWNYGGEQGVDYGYDTPVDQRPFNQYIGQEYYLCPSDKGTPDYVAASGNETLHEGRGLSYPLNGYNSGGYGDANPHKWLGVIGRKTTDVSNPLFVVAGDASMDNYWASDNYKGYNDDGYDFFWHDQKKITANLLFADASVQYCDVRPGYSQMYPDGTKEDDKSMYWWENNLYSYSPIAINKRTSDEWEHSEQTSGTR